MYKTQNNRFCGKDFDSCLVLVGNIFINILFITIFRMTDLFAERNAVLLFQVIFAVVCNGHPVDQIFTTGKINISFRIQFALYIADPIVWVT